MAFFKSIYLLNCLSVFSLRFLAILCFRLDFCLIIIHWCSNHFNRQNKGGLNQSVYILTVYYSIMTSFNHIRSRERAKYASVLNSNWKIMRSNNKPLIYGLTDNARGYFTLCSHFALLLRDLEKYYATRKISARIICQTIK